MRKIAMLMLVAGLVVAHGESGRSAGAGNGGGVAFGVRHGGGGPPTNPRGGPVTIVPRDFREHTWEHWWAYNRERILAARLRGTPTTGVELSANDRLSRSKLRDELGDLLLVALEDKHHDVRAAAAVALGKLADPRADRHLTRHIHFPPEKWFDVREASVYAMGLLGLPENRKTMTIIAGDKERTNKKRGLALVGFLMDGTQESADLLVWHLKYTRTGIHAVATEAPLTAEQERRRVAAHLLGFVKRDGYDDLLLSVARGARHWRDGEQGLAITALGRRRAKEHREALFRMFYGRDLDREARRSIPIALGKMIGASEHDEIDRLVRLIRDAKHDNVTQNFGVMALADIGGDHALDRLADLLRARVFATDNDRSFVYLALGLAGLRSDRAKAVLLGEYAKARTRVERGALAVACGLAKAKDAIPVTTELLEKTSLGASGGDERSFLGWGALGLGLHGDRKSLPVVREVFRKYSDAHVRESCAIALCLLEGKAAVPTLVQVLEEAGTMHTKAAAVTALGVLPEPSREAVDALIEAYRDDSQPDSVRAMAIIALGALADPRPVPVSATLVSGYNYFIRSATLDELATLL